MTIQEQKLTDIIKDGQSGKYRPFARHYTGRITQVMELKNPLDGSCLVDDIERVLEVLNPEFKLEIEWFKGLQSALKLWCNEKIIANRLLGLKNDNEYDTRIFEKVVMQHFFLSEKPKHTTVIETNFATLVEMVETGARRFGR